MKKLRSEAGATDTRASMEAIYNECSVYDEKWIRAAARVERRPVEASIHEPSYAWRHTADRLNNPWVAMVRFTCPLCNMTQWMTSRAPTGRQAVDKLVTVVVCHGLQCQEDDDD